MICYVNTSGTQSNSMAKGYYEQHPCSKEVSKDMGQILSNWYPETGQRLLSAKELYINSIAVSHVQVVLANDPDPPEPNYRSHYY